MQRKSFQVNNHFTYYGRSLGELPIQTYLSRKKFFVNREYCSTSAVSSTVEQIIKHKGMGA